MDKTKRNMYGMLCGVAGIIFNIMLFAGKLFAGTISGAISITADAFNNLSDAGSSLITLVGFKMASQQADEKHPYGHARIEYVATLAVSAIIIQGFCWKDFKSITDRIFTYNNMDPHGFHSSQMYNGGLQFLFRQKDRFIHT